MQHATQPSRSSSAATSHAHAATQVRILGPECPPISTTDLQRLFAGAALTPARCTRLAEWSRVVAACGDCVVAVATYQRIDTDLRVPDFAVDPRCGCSTYNIIGTVVDALELACLAGGGHRIVIMPPTATAGNYLVKRGYVLMREGCAGTWIEKTFS